MEKHRLAKLAGLDQAVRDQEDKVEERRKVLATIIRTKGIIYKGKDSLYPESGVNEDAQAKTALETYNQLEQARMQLGSQIDSLLKYQNEQLMVYATGLDLPDNTVKLLYPKYQEAKRALNSLKANGRGEDDSAVRTQSGQMIELKRQIDQATLNLKAMLQAQWDMANDRLENLEAANREKQIKRDPASQDYLDAKRDFETDQKLLQELKLKQVAEKITKEKTVQ